MLRHTVATNVKYLHGVRAKPSAGPESVVDSVLTANKTFLNAPTSTKSFFESSMYAGQNSSRRRGVQIGNSDSDFKEAFPSALTQRHQEIMMKLGGAQILSGTSQQFLRNDNRANPIFYSNTSPKEAGLCAALISALRKLKIHQLTELQGALVPLLVRGKHVIAHAETGTGKSFGIALAVANKILRDSVTYRMHTIIFTPTEELALQYDRWLKHFGGCASQICQPALASIPFEVQLTKLHNIQPHVLVGTPDRISQLADAAPHIFGHRLRRQVDTIILDEGDLVLNAKIMSGGKALTGEDLINKLYRSNPGEVPAQIVVASATVDGPTAQKVNAWMRNDTAVRLTTSFAEHSIPDSIQFYFVSGTGKVDKGDGGGAAGDRKKLAPSPVVLSSSGEGEVEREVSPTATSHVTPQQHLPPTPSKFADFSLLKNTLKLILKHHLDPKIIVFTSHDPDAISYDINRCMEDILSTQRKKSRTVPSGGSGGVLAGPLSQRRIPAVATDESTGGVGRGDPRKRRVNPHKPLDHHIKKSEIHAEDAEISVKNESNISKLSDGRLIVGVGSFSISRGMHIGSVSHVLIFGDTPSSSEFVHCAGRTGRMGADGEVFVLFPPSSGRTCQQICQGLEIPFQITRRSVLEKLLTMEDFFEEDARRIKDQERAARLEKRAAEHEETRDNLFSLLEDDDAASGSAEDAGGAMSADDEPPTSHLDDEEAARKLASHQRSVSDILSDQYSDPLAFLPSEKQAYLRELWHEDGNSDHDTDGVDHHVHSASCAHHQH